VLPLYYKAFVILRGKPSFYYVVAMNVVLELGEASERVFARQGRNLARGSCESKE
jgi:hypothetical protein